jgi:NADH:ubiquinone oxidoreductase subunit 4 (subunit M)
VFAAAYYLRLLQICVIRPRGEGVKELREASPVIVAPLVILMILLIIIGCYPWPLLDIARSAASALLQP